MIDKNSRLLAFHMLFYCRPLPMLPTLTFLVGITIQANMSHCLYVAAQPKVAGHRFANSHNSLGIIIMTQTVLKFSTTFECFTSCVATEISPKNAYMWNVES